MFIHQGKRRNLRHNLQIASLLSFVAGLVNVAGFLAVQKLTTNVTGHFAFFVDEVYQFRFWNGLVYFGYIFFFFLGSFASSFLVELMTRRNLLYIYIVPTSIEIVILASVAVYGPEMAIHNPDLLACSLLFAMGLQNSLVTRISNATVRTTHLTGLFTDLGIELSQLFFNSQPELRSKLWSSIRLRLTIISYFFIGGTIGGLFYPLLGIRILYIGAAALLLGLVYHSVKLRLLLLRRKYSTSRRQ